MGVMPGGGVNIVPSLPGAQGAQATTKATDQGTVTTTTRSSAKAISATKPGGAHTSHMQVDQAADLHVPCCRPQLLLDVLASDFGGGQVVAGGQVVVCLHTTCIGHVSFGGTAIRLCVLTERHAMHIAHTAGAATGNGEPRCTMPKPATGNGEPRWLNKNQGQVEAVQVEAVPPHQNTRTAAMATMGIGKAKHSNLTTATAAAAAYTRKCDIEFLAIETGNPYFTGELINL